MNLPSPIPDKSQQFFPRLRWRSLGSPKTKAANILCPLNEQTVVEGITEPEAKLIPVPVLNLIVEAETDRFVGARLAGDFWQPADRFDERDFAY
jgi:hypothetical protein